MNARRVSMLLGAVAAVLALAFIAFFAVGANQPADPSLEEKASTTAVSTAEAPGGTEAPAGPAPAGSDAPGASPAPSATRPAPGSAQAAPRATRPAPGTTQAAPGGSAAAPSSSTAPSAAQVAPASSAAPRARQPVEGFGQIAFRLRGGATAAELCALLAESPAQLSKGLMGRRDLAGYDGMVFRFASDTSGPFYMRNVPIPLEIAWFDAAGRFVSSADMAPCADQEGCPLYPPAGPYRYALEVLDGGLAQLGVKEGTVLVLEGGCG